MICNNCGKNEASIRLTQIINGKKTEMMICEECAKKIGIPSIDLDMPIDISNFLGDFISDDDNSPIIPFNELNPPTKCKKCNMTYEEFVNTGKFGCEECYETFKDKINNLLKRIQGTEKYLGRKANKCDNNKIEKTETNKNMEDLQKQLKQAIKEERYEDAAKIRDQIRKEGT